ncbi:transglycosylase domain-containing protein, partial [Candidatus Desantisbacteria bacterium]|nr:transglycosylase domain-containing protein [Candidatus Desantisbacteria bacterium]
FGTKIYGIKAAANTNFGKEPHDLTPLEGAFIVTAATLTGLVTSIHVTDMVCHLIIGTLLLITELFNAAIAAVFEAMFAELVLIAAVFAAISDVFLDILFVLASILSELTSIAALLALISAVLEVILASCDAISDALLFTACSKTLKFSFTFAALAVSPAVNVFGIVILPARILDAIPKIKSIQQKSAKFFK